jgi:hypothetical protein
MTLEVSDAESSIILPITDGDMRQAAERLIEHSGRGLTGLFFRAMIKKEVRRLDGRLSPTARAARATLHCIRMIARFAAIYFLRALATIWYTITGSPAGVSVFFLFPGGAILFYISPRAFWITLAAGFGIIITYLMILDALQERDGGRRASSRNNQGEEEPDRSLIIRPSGPAIPQQEVFKEQVRAARQVSVEMRSAAAAIGPGQYPAVRLQREILEKLISELNAAYVRVDAAQDDELRELIERTREEVSKSNRILASVGRVRRALE